MESSSLWVHIDLAIGEGLHLGRAQFDRIHTYATRSGELPLHIHIVEQETLGSHLRADKVSLNNILRSLVGRMGGLDFTISGELRFQNSLLSTMMSDCTPQIFTKLATDSKRQYNTFIISANDTNPEAHENYLRVSLSPDQLEHSLSHLSVLHLVGLFPKWTSVAYHGLVDLRLTSSDSYFSSSIKEVELTNILRASPALRILYLELEITDRLSDAISVTPVPLEYLQVLSITIKIDDFPFSDEAEQPVDAGMLLRHFAPGSLPLRFTFQTADYANSGPFDEIKKFFMRSNVVKFCSLSAYPPLNELLPYAPNIRALVFRNCASGEKFMDLTSQANRNVTLDSWHMQFCRTTISDLSAIILLCPRELVLAGCTVYRYPPRSTVGEGIPEVELLWTFPLVRFISEEDYRGLSDPTRDWDILE